MDPAFLVWIPPIDEGNIIHEMDGNEPHYEEILPRPVNVSSGSNTETPEDDDDDEKSPKVPPKPPRRSISSTYQTNQEIKALLSKSPKNDEGKESIQMSDLTPQKRLLKEAAIDVEKETQITLIKASTDNRIADYYGLSDIQFADEVDDMDDEVRYIDENKRVEAESRRYKV